MGKIGDATDGTEDGKFEFWAYDGGTQTQSLVIEGGKITKFGDTTASDGKVLTWVDSSSKVEWVAPAQNKHFVNIGFSRLRTIGGSNYYYTKGAALITAGTSKTSLDFEDFAHGVAFTFPVAMKYVKMMGFASSGSTSLSALEIYIQKVAAPGADITSDVTATDLESFTTGTTTDTQYEIDENAGADTTFAAGDMIVFLTKEGGSTKFWSGQLTLEFDIV